ncbi:MAG: hypothetical protein CL878_00375, partial [Dehalococcoidia bacterium]|nr:hypothetical protein [Dehalococcoidia bacterium]
MEPTLAKDDAATARSEPAKPRRVVNRLNDLDGKGWLPFQKSWFLDHSAVYEEFISFFTKRFGPEGAASVVLTLAGVAEGRPGSAESISEAAESVGRKGVVWDDGPLDGHLA